MRRCHALSVLSVRRERPARENCAAANVPRIRGLGSLEQRGMNRRSSADNASSKTPTLLATFASSYRRQGPREYKDQNAGPRRYPRRIYTASSPNAFIIPRCQRLAFSPLLSVLLLSPPLSFSFSFSYSGAFVELPAFCFKHDTMHTQHARDAHSRSRPPPPCPPLLALSLSLSLSHSVSLVLSSSCSARNGGGSSSSSRSSSSSSFCSFFALVSSLPPPPPPPPPAPSTAVSFVSSSLSPSLSSASSLQWSCGPFRARVQMTAGPPRECRALRDSL